MNRGNPAAISLIAMAALFLAGCGAGPKAPAPSLTEPSASPSAVSNVPTSAVSNVPKVQNPLPSSVLDGTPCDSALTAEQLNTFLGQWTPAKAQDTQLGLICQWSNAAGSGSGITVGYQTKSDDGLGLAYENVKPKAARWKVLEPIQGYPAIAYSDFDDKRVGVIVVGVSDKLAYSISLTLGDKAMIEGKDAFDLGPQVADAVLTNLKARA